MYKCMYIIFIYKILASFLSLMFTDHNTNTLSSMALWVSIQIFSKIFQATSKNILKKLGVQKWVEQGHEGCVES